MFRTRRSRHEAPRFPGIFLPLGGGKDYLGTWGTVATSVVTYLPRWDTVRVWQPGTRWYRQEVMTGSCRYLVVITLIAGRTGLALIIWLPHMLSLVA